MMTKRPRGPYLLSLPERLLRSSAAILGGAVYEATEVLLPSWLRGSSLYTATVARLLRITIELLGGVSDVYASENVDVRELAVRKAVGNVLEAAGFLAIGWSPLWLLAAAADLTGGTRAYLRALVGELKRAGVLPKESEFGSAEELLNALERTSGVLADTVDVPPLNVSEMRASWQSLKQNVGGLPEAGQLAGLFAQLQRAAEQEGHSLRSMSTLIGVGAVRTGVQMGNVYIFDYYRQSLVAIRLEGLAAYLQRVARPYLEAAARNFDSRHETYSERLLHRARRKPATTDKPQT